MNEKSNDYEFFFHATHENKQTCINFLNKENLSNFQVISEEGIKHTILSHSIFAVAKSGTISLEICNQNIPSIIIYKINFINYIIICIFCSGDATCSKVSGPFFPCCSKPGGARQWICFRKPGGAWQKICFPKPGGAWQKMCCLKPFGAKPKICC